MTFLLLKLQNDELSRYSILCGKNETKLQIENCNRDKDVSKMITEIKVNQSQSKSNVIRLPIILPIIQYINNTLTGRLCVEYLWS